MDEVRLEVDHYLSPKTVTVNSGLVIRRHHWRVALVLIGMVNGHAIVHQSREPDGVPDMAPDWPNGGPRRLPYRNDRFPHTVANFRWFFLGALGLASTTPSR
jgi:hypothetical protein